MTREDRLARTLVELADTLVEGFDLAELLTMLVDRAVELLDATAVGLLLTDSEGKLRVMASTSEALERVECFGVEHDQGPCLDCYRSGRPVVVSDLGAAATRWPRFVPVALDAGFGSANALPLRLRGQILGALNMFRSRPGGLDNADISAGQALADMAAIAILQSHAAFEAHVVADQLTYALHSRVAIEQAKGILAERAGIGVDEAFSRLRGYARSHRLPLTAVAQELVAGTLAEEAIAG